MKDIVAIILAAGRGTRMKSDTPKVLHKIMGRPVISCVLDSLKNAGIKDMIAVTGYGNELLKEPLRDVKTVVQKELLGSGDAVKTAQASLKDYEGDVLIICGDTPLIKSETIRALAERHKKTRASLTILTANLKDPTGYGRIARDEDGRIEKIVEEEKARLFEEVIGEVNVGTYCFNARDLYSALAEVKPDNAKKEFFLTDTIEILRGRNKVIESVTLGDASEMIGVNSRKDLAEATRVMKYRILADIMAGGVTIEDPESTIIHGGVKIGRDTVIYSNTVIESDVEIGERCHIGPFTRLRPAVRLADEVEVGNFVELVRTSVGTASKIKHHTYLGDTTVGSHVNIGAGTITANYDGKSKNRTAIEDNVFIGIGARLVAPVTVGAGAVVGAGCVVPKNHNVPKGATVVGVPARVLQKK